MLRASARLGVVVTSEVITANEQLNARKFYFYDPEGHLLSETELTTAASPAIAYEYIWFGGEPVAQIRTATNQIHFYFNDHLGTPILTTDGNGVVDWQSS
ncbi:MAG TPA: RHS domain-containing protein, partial [Thermoanaerobaculia bacterium]|nr:RHS domain-containing protein [Thermoanaerobaculia bacterium]